MDEHAQETYKSMLSISVEGMKALLLIPIRAYVRKG